MGSLTRRNGEKDYGEEGGEKMHTRKGSPDTRLKKGGRERKWID